MTTPAAHHRPPPVSGQSYVADLVSLGAILGRLGAILGRHGAILGVSWRHLGGGWPSGVRKPGLAWIWARIFKVQGLARGASWRHENAIRIPFSAFFEFSMLKEI